MGSSEPDQGRPDHDSERRNRAAWDRWSDTYQAKHGWLLRGDHAAAWGLWRLPEDTVHVLGDVTGRKVLELGCGAAHWSAELARRGARMVALDNSSRQLRHARNAAAGHRVALVQATAEYLPFADASFDIVFSDYGGMSWADPAVAVPEAARILERGGLLAFCTTSPFFFLFLDPETGELRTELQRDYFGMRSRTVAGAGIDYQVPFGEWIRLFIAAGLVVEDLIEVRPPDDATTTFRDRPLSWASRWPVENIWRVRKA
jgi:SAM-dependent methyltransferase